MSVKMFYSAEAPIEALKGQKIAVIGYGSQGHAHARNLKESGLDVVVGLKEGSKSRAVAEGDGLKVASVADAVKSADVVMIATPDTGQKALYERDIAPNLKPGTLLLFAHGFNIHFGRIAPAAGIDVGMVAPKGPGHLVRSVYVSGGGVPALFAIHQDASGTARARVMAYANGLGAGPVVSNPRTKVDSSHSPVSLLYAPPLLRVVTRPWEAYTVSSQPDENPPA